MCTAFLPLAQPSSVPCPTTLPLGYPWAALPSQLPHTSRPTPAASPSRTIYLARMLSARGKVRAPARLPLGADVSMWRTALDAARARVAASSHLVGHVVRQRVAVGGTVVEVVKPVLRDLLLAHLVTGVGGSEFACICRLQS